MRNARGLWIFAVILLLIDTYIFQVLKYLSQGLSPRAKFIVYAIYWLITVLSIIIALSLPSLYFNPKYKQLITYAFSMVMGLFFFKLICCTFFIIDDVRRVITWCVLKLGQGSTTPTQGGVTRSAFISWLGVAVGGGIFSSLIYGFSNKYNYNTKTVKLQYPNLPSAFKGLRIVQLSDIHSGSFDDEAAVLKGVYKVLELKPDMILFTGDLVNNITTEMEAYKDIFAKLQAPLGIYSVLGNHDYGDYYTWEDRDEAHLLKEAAARKRLASPLQQKNIQDLIALQQSMGWQVLMNEHVILERNNQKIAVIGIENWSARGNFPKYGKLDIAYAGTQDVPFKILLSHDPSHWNAQVTKQYTDIDLTLSGHTHGMQFGIEIPGLRWSPIQYVYKQWAGVYEYANQKLYVNRGFGFLGYPGRVGILPEITLIELT